MRSTWEECATSRIVEAVEPERATVSVATWSRLARVATSDRYVSASVSSAFMAVCFIVGCDTMAGQYSVALLTTRRRTTDPPEARARRVATGMARSARRDPSRGTTIR